MKSLPILACGLACTAFGVFYGMFVTQQMGEATWIILSSAQIGALVLYMAVEHQARKRMREHINILHAQIMRHHIEMRKQQQAVWSRPSERREWMQ